MKKVELRVWVDIAEIAASVAVVVTLVILIAQIRESSLIEQRESAIRAAEWDAAVFLQSETLASTISKIKAVDGIEDGIQEFMDRYDASYEQAAAWNRYLVLNWAGMQADYLYHGRSESLDQRIRYNLQWPDQRILIRDVFGEAWSPFHREFDEYVVSLLADQE